MEYLKIWTSFREVITPLNDAEKGRLFDAMLNYAADGEEPDLKGNERFIWPAARQAIDRAAQKAETLRQNGNRGGRPPKPTETKDNQTKPNETKENQTEPEESYLFDKDKEKEKEKKDIKENPIKGVKENRRFSPPSVEEVSAYCQERQNNVDPQRFVDFYVSKGWKVGQNPMRDWKAAVRTWEQRDGEQGKRPAKVVSAQQYTQRKYAAGELDSIGDDLIDEVRRQRDGGTGTSDAVPVGPDAGGTLAGTGADASYTQWGW